MSLRSLHVVELGGQGGVFQHVLGAAENGVYESWDRVVLHTACDAEAFPSIPGFRYHRCLRWQRSGSRAVRRSMTAAWTIGIFIPHLILTALTRRDEWEVQGQFGRGLYYLFILIPRMLGLPVTFVPHNSFVRDARWWEGLLLRSAFRLATRVVIFVPSEAARFPAAVDLELRQLWQYAPSPSASTLASWRQRLGSGRPTIVFVGQLRQDKNPLLLIDAVNLLRTQVNLVFAGADKGAGSAIDDAHIDHKHKLILEKRFLALEEIVGLIQLSDVVVCPYAVASQSGVVALANQLGRPAVVSSAGGLREQSPWTFELGEAQTEDLAKLLCQFLGQECEQHD